MLALARLLASRFGTHRVFKDLVPSPEFLVLSQGPRVLSFQVGSRFGFPKRNPHRALGPWRLVATCG